MERIEVEDPLNKLDFLYVASGCIEFLLEHIINPNHLKQSSRTGGVNASSRTGGMAASSPGNSRRLTMRSNNYFNLKQGGHIDAGDLKLDQEMVQISQSMKLHRLKTMSNRSSANQLLRMATDRMSGGPTTPGSGGPSFRKKLAGAANTMRKES